MPANVYSISKYDTLEFRIKMLLVCILCRVEECLKMNYLRCNKIRCSFAHSICMCKENHKHTIQLSFMLISLLKCMNPSFFIAFRFNNVKPTQNITMYHIVINKSLFLQQKLFRENTVILVL